MHRRSFVAAALAASTGPWPATAAPSRTPAGMPGLQLWLRADQGVFNEWGLPAADGDPVAIWGDLSPHLNDSTQEQAASRPTLQLDAVGGHPALAFNGTTAFLRHGFGGEPGTILAVYRVNILGTSNQSQALLGADTTDATATGAYELQAVTGFIDGQRRQTYSRATTADNAAPSWAAATQPNCEVWQQISVRSTAAGLSLFKSGHACGAPTLPPSDATARPIAPDSGTIGAGSHGRTATDFLDGSIAELIVFDRALSDAELQSVSAYLTRRYALEPSGRYLWAGFQGGKLKNENLTLMQSADGLTWSYRPSHYLPPAGDVVRDPTIMAKDGVTWIAHTICTLVGGLQPCTAFALARSTDGFAFEFVTLVDCSSIAIDAANSETWAPEWFIDGDGSVHLFVAISPVGRTDKGFQIYELHPTSDDLTTWSQPLLVTGSGFPSNMIDPFIIRLDGLYVLWFKDENLKYVEYATSSSLTGDYTLKGSGDFEGWGKSLEGPALVKLPGGDLRIYLDHQGGGYYHSESTDGGVTWSAKQPVTAPFTMQHGTVISARKVPPLR